MKVQVSKYMSVVQVRQEVNSIASHRKLRDLFHYKLH